MTGWKRWLIPGLALPFLALLAFGLTKDPTKVPSPLIGRQSPDFRLVSLDGDTISTASLRGQVVVLNFWASWCLACRVEHPVLLRAHRAFSSGGGRSLETATGEVGARPPGRQRARVLGIVYQDDPASARQYLEQRGGGWTNLMDPDSHTAIDFGVYGVPETFVIAPDGTIAYKSIGPVTWDVLSSKVDSLLAAEPGA